MMTLIFASASPVFAQDYVISKGKLSDQNFYRLIACAAPPGGACQHRPLRWSKQKQKQLRIALASVDNDLPAKWVSSAKGALQKAIAEINGVNSGIKLVLVSERADIRVAFISQERISTRPAARNFNEILATSATGMARLFVPNGSGTIQKAEVTITQGVEIKRLQSVVLEEVIQSLGLVTDIHNRYYHNRSIFSETGSRAKRLRGQDAKALLMHYPRT